MTYSHRGSRLQVGRQVYFGRRTAEGVATGQQTEAGVLGYTPEGNVILQQLEDRGATSAPDYYEFQEWSVPPELVSYERGGPPIAAAPSHVGVREPRRRPRDAPVSTDDDGDWQY